MVTQSRQVKGTRRGKEGRFEVWGWEVRGDYIVREALRRWWAKALLCVSGRVEGRGKGGRGGCVLERGQGEDGRLSLFATRRSSRGSFGWEGGREGAEKERDCR